MPGQRPGGEGVAGAPVSAAWRREVYHCRARRQCAQYRRPVYREAVGPVHCAECNGLMEWQRSAALPGSESKEQKTVKTTKATKTKTQPKPDAWLALVLSTMGVAELRRELQTATGDERRWMQEELERKTKAGAR